MASTNQSNDKSSISETYSEISADISETYSEIDENPTIDAENPDTPDGDGHDQDTSPELSNSELEYEAEDEIGIPVRKKMKSESRITIFTDNKKSFTLKSINIKSLNDFEEYVLDQKNRMKKTIVLTEYMAPSAVATAQFYLENIELSKYDIKVLYRDHVRFFITLKGAISICSSSTSKIIEIADGIRLMNLAPYI